jgi:hypothetical protein
MTTYTLITYRESSQYYDRWGDLSGDPSAFDICYFTDSQEAAQAFARARHAGYDEKRLLINGEDHEDLLYGDDLTKADEARALEALIAEEDEIETVRLAEAKKAATEKAAREAEAKARQLAQAQKAADEAQFEALRRKLGR